MHPGGEDTLWIENAIKDLQVIKLPAVQEVPFDLGKAVPSEERCNRYPRRAVGDGLGGNSKGYSEEDQGVICSFDPQKDR